VKTSRRLVPLKHFTLYGKACKNYITQFNDPLAYNFHQYSLLIPSSPPPGSTALREPWPPVLFASTSLYLGLCFSILQSPSPVSPDTVSLTKFRTLAMFVNVSSHNICIMSTLNDLPPYKAHPEVQRSLCNDYRFRATATFLFSNYKNHTVTILPCFTKIARHKTP
jgi:hypothetical protein